MSLYQSLIGVKLHKNKHLQGNKIKMSAKRVDDILD